MDRIIKAALVVVVLMGMMSVVEADEAKIKTVTIHVPKALNEVTRGKVIGQFEKLQGERFVYLDFTQGFDTGASHKPPFFLEVAGKPSSEYEKGCGFAPLQMGAGINYSIGPVAGNNHLLMTVYTGDRTSFPYHDVACEYSASGATTIFHVRGFFYVMANSVPTAISLQLRPFTPSLQTARDVLARQEN